MFPSTESPARYSRLFGGQLLERRPHLRKNERELKARSVVLPCSPEVEYSLAHSFGILLVRTLKVPGLASLVGSRRRPGAPRRGCRGPVDGSCLEGRARGQGPIFFLIRRTATDTANATLLEQYD